MNSEEIKSCLQQCGIIMKYCPIYASIDLVYEYIKHYSNFKVGVKVRLKKEALEYFHENKNEVSEEILDFFSKNSEPTIEVLYNLGACHLSGLKYGLDLADLELI